MPDGVEPVPEGVPTIWVSELIGADDPVPVALDDGVLEGLLEVTGLPVPETEAVELPVPVE